MSASYEATRQIFFGGNRPSAKLTLKTKWNSCSYCDDSHSCEQLKKCVADK